MSLLVTGLVLFIAIHLIPSAPRLRAALVERLGAKPYRGVFSAVVLLSLVAVVWGFSRSPIGEVYAPPAWGHQASMILVPVALVLFAAANMPTRIRAVVRHPMLLGLLLWAFAHLLSNGEVRSVVLFGGFALFSVVEIVSAVARGKGPSKEPVPRITMDIAAVIGGLIVSGLLAVFHGTLFGEPVM
ncbi:NnrU family protein [Candidatus Poribacteria bacterium]|nr:NnrU family protein [Gammaproteobacteria bacterium]MYF97749.1 NnrU family protein [Candidatus Poribacteria bacterium]